MPAALGEHTPSEIRLVSDGDDNKLQYRSSNDAQYDPERNTLRPPNPRKRMWKLFQDQLPGLVCTIVLLFVYVGILAGYEGRPVTHRGKITYNTLTTANLIALGLSFFGIFKTMAKVVRWRLLERRPREPREVDLLLGADSIENAFLLMCSCLRRCWRRGSKSIMALIAAGFILLNFAAQVAVSLIQLNASMENGWNSSSITSSPGTVMVPKLDCFYLPNNNTCPPLTDASPSTVAHSYGEAVDVRAESGCSYVGNAQDIEGRQQCTYFKRDDGPVEFAVRFPDYTPGDYDERIHPFLDTHRFVTVNATNCRTMNATYTPGNNAGSVEDVLMFPSGMNGSVNISIPRGDLNSDATTYIWHGSVDPRNETDVPVENETCGPRCVYLYAIRDSWEGTNHSINTYQCEIHVSEVSNPTSEHHLLSSNMARTAAAAAALTGEPHEANPDLNTPPDNITIRNWDQFHSYPLGADWAAYSNETADQIGQRMARFAAAALGTMALRAPPTEAQGMVSDLGNMLDVEWRYVAGLAAAIAGAHLLLVFSMLYVVRRTAVPDDSAFVVSGLLNNVTRDLPDGAEARLDEEAVAKHIAVGREMLSDDSSPQLERRTW